MSPGETPEPSGTAIHILIISRRRLIAEAVQELMCRQRLVERCVVAGPDDHVGDLLARLDEQTVIVDLDDPGQGLNELANYLEEAPLARRIGIYDTFTSPNAQQAFRFGLTALVPLTATPAQMVEVVLSGSGPSSATATVGLTRQEFARLNSLTPRELEVLEYIAQGLSIKAVAARLGVTAHTVATHQRRCFAKLGVRRRAHAVALAASAGMITSNPH